MRTQLLKDHQLPPSNLVTIHSTVLSPDADAVEQDETYGTFAGFQFSHAGGTLELEDGIVLSTGRVLRDGTQLTENLSLGFCGYARDPEAMPTPAPRCGESGEVGGDPDIALQYAAPVPNMDDFASIVMSFTPHMGVWNIQFQMVLASEEFPEWAGERPTEQFGTPPLDMNGDPAFTDTFGAFLNSINFALQRREPCGLKKEVINVAEGVIDFNNNTYLGPHSYDTAECDPPAVAFDITSCVDQNLHANQYTDVNWDIEYDGLTRVFTFTAPVLPEQLYTLKLSVADLADPFLDTSAFISSLEFLGAAPDISSSTPADGWIDPLSQADGVGTPRFKQFTVVFSEPVFDQDGSALSIDAFSLACTNAHANDPDFQGVNNPCPSIQSVNTSQNPTIVVTLDNPIPFGEWTSLACEVENAEGVETTECIDVGHLPDDVNQNRTVNIQDATAFGCEFNGQKRLELVDTNRDGSVDVRDATAFGDLFDGDSGFIRWNTKTLPDEPLHP